MKEGEKRGREKEEGREGTIAPISPGLTLQCASVPSVSVLEMGPGTRMAPAATNS